MTKALSLTLKIALGSFFLILLVHSTPVGASYVLDDDLEAYNSMPFFFSGTGFYAINQAYGSITTSFGYSGTHSIAQNATFSLDTIGRDFAQPTGIGHVRLKLYLASIEETGDYSSGDSIFYIQIVGSNAPVDFRIQNFGRTTCSLCTPENDAHDDVVLQAGWNDILLSWNGNSFAFSVNGDPVTESFNLGNIETVVLGSYPATQGQVYIDNIQISGDDDAFEFDFEIGGETPTGTVPQQYVTIIRPEYGTTTASTTVTTEINFRTPFSIDFRPTTTRSYIITDAVTGEIEHAYSVTIPANSAESLNVDDILVLADGSKILTAGYMTTSGAWYSEVAETFFNVATNTYLMATGLETPRSGSGGQTQIDCTTFDVGCQFQKAMQFVFRPSPDSLDRFANIWTLIETKKPFGYVTVTIAQLTGLNQEADPYFTMPTIPFMEAVFTPMKAGLGAILWGIFFILWYHKRLKHLVI